MLRPSRSPVRQYCCAPGATTTGAYFGEERRNAPDPVARQCDVTNDHCRAVSRPRVVSPQRTMPAGICSFVYRFIHPIVSDSARKKSLKQWERQLGGGGILSQDPVYSIGANYKLHEKPVPVTVFPHHHNLSYRFKSIVFSSRPCEVGSTPSCSRFIFN